MYQASRGQYRTNESVIGMFFNSCFGKSVIAVIVILFLVLIASISCPSERRMRESMTDNIRQCIEVPDSIQSDRLDDALAYIGYFFGSANPEVNIELMNRFNRYNRLEYYGHGLYSTLYVFNNYHTEGLRVGVGFFGMVFPTISPDDFLLEVSTLRRDYNERIIEVPQHNDTLYFGETPDLIFHDLPIDE